jgi:hypothetical protein
MIIFFLLSTVYTAKKISIKIYIIYAARGLVQKDDFTFVNRLGIFALQN